MKTVWIIDHYSSEPKYGGISRQYDFANALAKKGYNVVVIASSFSHFTHSYINNDSMYISRVNENVTYVYLKTTKYTENSGKERLCNMLSFHRIVVKKMKVIAEECGAPDVVNGCSVHPFAWTAAYAVSKKFNSKFVVEVRDLWPEVWVLSGKKSRYSPMVIGAGMLEKWVYRRAEEIIYSMSKGHEYISGKLGINKSKTHLIGQPMDCERFDLNASKNFELVPEETREFMKDSFICTFAGYYMTYEGIYTMLEVAKKIQEKKLPIKMVFVGSGEEKKGMQTFVRENNLKNVFIGDRISKEAIPSLLKNSNIVMAHLAVEGHKEAYKYGVSKNKVNEYLYSGAVTLYGFHDKEDVVVTSGGGFVFDPFNSVQLFEFVLRIYNMDSQERRKIGEKGRDYIKNNHSSEILSNKLEAIFFNKTDLLTK